MKTKVPYYNFSKTINIEKTKLKLIKDLVRCSSLLLTVVKRKKKHLSFVRNFPWNEQNENNSNPVKMFAPGTAKTKIF